MVKLQDACFSLMQVGIDLTHFSQSGHGTIIDLALVSVSPSVTECTIMPLLTNLDHNSVFLQVKVKETKYKAKSLSRHY